MARPIAYNREQVLTEAMHVFWRQGYYGSSMAQLIEATRLKPGSLYGAFSSKEALFKAAIDYYGDHMVHRIQTNLYSKDSALEGIKSWINSIVVEVIDEANKGCFLVNTVIEQPLISAEVSERIDGYLKMVRSLISKRLSEAQSLGEIAKDKDVEALSSFILCIVCGLRVVGQTTLKSTQVGLIRDQLLGLISA